ncbi:hypothetical protein AX16_001598 [Volvariella volvacea WC 439]|nr:hypothetical protein AX16_001598 [Volvariella volvacea WC 439]
MTTNTVDQALLVATLHSLSPAPHYLASVITAAATATRERLIIILFSRLFNSAPGLKSESRRGSTSVPDDSGRLKVDVPASPVLGGGSLDAPHKKGISHTEEWDDVQRLLTYVYVQATKVAQDLDKVLLDVDILLKGLDEDLPDEVGEGIDVVYRVSGDCIAVPLPGSIRDTRQIYVPAGDRDPDLIPPASLPSSPVVTSPKLSANAETLPAPSLFPVVALGGTFDHLHAGHKILLSMGAWIAAEKIIVGVTDDALLQGKSNKHVLQKLPERMERVRQFLSLFKPGIVYDIVPIQDVYGPTGWDPNIQALVVSKETLSGADSIHAHRANHSLPALQTFIIDVISPSESSLDHDDLEMLKKTKMSSTFIREWIVNKQKEASEGSKVE